jgi:hypothetical protein
VDDLNAVEAAVVDLILGGLEQVVVAERVVAGPRQRASYEQDPAPPPATMAGKPGFCLSQRQRCSS